MTQTAAIPARSTHGCWTCRLRKKKCDETHPECSTCTSLRLECHGYGPRPRWMDNGMLQKREASKDKYRVSRAKWKRGERRALDPNQPPPLTRHQRMGSLSSETSSLPVTPPSVSSPYRMLDTLPEDGPCYQVGELDLNFLVDAAWDLPPWNAVSAPEPSLDLESFTVTPAVIQSKYFVQDSVFLESCDETPVQAPTSSIVENVDEGWGDVSWQDFESPYTDSTRYDSEGLQDGIFHRKAHSSEETSPIEQLGHIPQGLAVSRGAEDDALFMHYLDHVFYSQYPFYNSQGIQGRGWLFSILRRVKPAYHGAMALSERHLLSMQPGDGNVNARVAKLRIQEGHYDLAIQGLRTILESTEKGAGPPRLLHSLEALASMLNVFFWELFNGGTGNWQTLLQAASQFVPVLLQTRHKENSTGVALASDQSIKTALSREDDCAASMLLGSFVWFDVISSCSSRSTPFLSINHLEAIETLGVSLESVVGCSSSVISLLYEISLLDNWKKKAQGAHKLSIVDLAKRGCQIKDRLRQELALIDDEHPEPLYASSKASRQPTYPGISRVFALSAITYLHVVVSGAYPELPEIKESVSETIAALKALKDPRQLRSLVWPFCISGCLALEEQHGSFRDLIFRADVTQATPGTFLEAYHIMEESWKTRGSCPDECDWTTAMKKRGRYVILA